jgi:hypothetical protein
MINEAVIPTISQTIRAMNTPQLVQPNTDVVTPTNNVAQTASVETNTHSVDTHA